jgi:uncharacterized protein YaiL (DUF2058 family)
MSVPFLQCSGSDRAVARAGVISSVASPSSCTSTAPSSFADRSSTAMRRPAGAHRRFSRRDAGCCCAQTSKTVRHVRSGNRDRAQRARKREDRERDRERQGEKKNEQIEREREMAGYRT